MGFESSDLDDLIKDFEKMGARAKDIEGENRIPLPELYDPNFMQLHTKHQTIEEFFSAGGFDISSDEAFDAIDQSELDSFVHSETNFEDWEDMQDAAVESWAEKSVLE